MRQALKFAFADATHADAAPMAALHAACFAKGWSEKSIANLLNDKGVLAHTVSVAPVNALAGIIMARGAGDEAEILTLAVARQFRRNGLAQTLITKISTRLAASGAERLFLEVDAENDAATALYEKHGFTVIGRRRNYYRRDGHPPRDALCLSLNLTGT